MKSDLNHIFHGLLYIDEKENAHVNLKGGADPIEVYLRCASLCAASVRYNGYSFRLVTNNKKRIEALLDRLSIPTFEIVEVGFTLDVPRGIPFYAAHFKLELYSMFGKGMFGNNVGVIDIDTVMIAPVDFSMLTPDTLLGYDITQQVGDAYGVERIRADIETVAQTKVNTMQWWGGELMFGSAEGFAKLSAAIASVWQRYLQHIGSLHHVGDEMLVSAAIAASSDLQMMDAGKRKIIVRWWSARTAHRQPSFASVKASSILHLPSDKSILSAYDASRFDPAGFIAHFENAVRMKLLRRQIVNSVERMLKRSSKYAARLT